MILKNRYAMGVLIQFYEIEMFPDFIDGIINMMEGIENPENVTLDICLDVSETFEKIEDGKRNIIWDKYIENTKKLDGCGIEMNTFSANDKIAHVPSIAWYRRDFNYRYADTCEYLIWLEADSFMPKEGFQAIEQINEYAESQHLYKYVISFAYRKMWDNSWAPLEHPEFKNVKYSEDKEWSLNDPASPKSYMTIETMNELNEKWTSDGFDLVKFNEPLFDGSCIVFTSEMVKAGINIPHALLMSGEDTSFGVIAKKVLGDKYIQLLDIS